jgi:hypothetical protein
MNSQPTSIDADKIFLLNRDHIISVATTTDRELIISTTFGKLVVAGQAQTLTEFRDELANGIGSNFVTVPLSLSAAHVP